jgi:thiol-disulfide isomerase/thioredoxin
LNPHNVIEQPLPGVSVTALILLTAFACTTTDSDETNFGVYGKDLENDADYGSDEAIVGGPDDDPDGDGFSNAEEEEAGTNPNYEYSHPYTGDYQVGFCRDKPNPTGPTKEQRYTDEDGNSFDYLSYQRGDVAENVTLQDRYGEEMDLYSFCGTHVMLVVSAGWCGPCRAEAVGLQAVADEYPEAQILQVLSQDDYGNIPSLAFLETWASQYNFETVAAIGPSTAPTTYDEYFSSVSSQFEDDGYIPTIFHLDTDMTILSADKGISTPDTWM